MKEISVDELKALRESVDDFQLIDVREEHEYEEANIGGELIPLATVVEQKEKIKTDKKVIIMCRSGKRSAMAVQILEQELGLDNLYNLNGGIIACANADML